MAITTLIYMPQGFAPVLFGAIGDRWGLRTSFYVALGVLAATLLFVQLVLPARPRPRQSDLGAEEALALAPVPTATEAITPAQTGLTLPPSVQRQEDLAKGESP
jgi:hypothetical protein